MSEIDDLQREGSKLPQLQVNTEHHFCDGMYIRMVRNIPAGTLIVGKRHKKEHFFVLISGKMAIHDENGVVVVDGLTVICADSGTKRALYTITDCAGMNIHRTELTDLFDIEKELVEPDNTSLFDAENKLKVEVTSCSWQSLPQ